MRHEEIRLSVLQLLYQKYFEGRRFDYQIVDKIYDELVFDKIVDKEAYYGDILYLHKRHLIDGEMILGRSYPPWVRINENGIDYVESITDYLSERLPVALSRDTDKEKLREISKETNTNTKLKKIMETAKLDSDIWTNIAMLIRAFSG